MTAPRRTGLVGIVLAAVLLAPAAAFAWPPGAVEPQVTCTNYLFAVAPAPAVERTTSEALVELDLLGPVFATLHISDRLDPEDRAQLTRSVVPWLNQMCFLHMKWPLAYAEALVWVGLVARHADANPSYAQASAAINSWLHQ